MLAAGHIILFFFFNDTATTEIYTLSLHDALPISGSGGRSTVRSHRRNPDKGRRCLRSEHLNDKGLTFNLTDRKSTRLNSSHANISYAVFCLKKKTKNKPRRDKREVAPGTLAYDAA